MDIYMFVCEMKRRLRGGWKEILGWGGLLCLAVFFNSNHIVSADEGVVLNGAWNLINHQGIYADFFEFIAPGSFYLLFAVWKIFGVSFWSAKALGIGFVFLGAIGLYKTSQQIIKNKPVNFLVAASFILISGWWSIVINHNVFNLAFLIWSNYFFVRGLGTSKRGDFVASGLLAGLAMLFLQQKGLAIFGGSIIFLIFLAIKNRQLKYSDSSLAFLLSGLAPLLLLLVFPWKSVFYSLVQFPFNGYVAVNQVSYGWLMSGFGMLILCVSGLLAMTDKSEKLFFLAFIQLALLLSACPLPDLYHVSMVMFPTLLLVFYLFFRLLELYGHGIVKKIMIAILALGLWGLFVFDMTVVAYNVTAPKRCGYKGIIDYITTNCPGKYLYAGPFAPNIYFETKKLNATPYDVLITRMATEEQLAKALDGFIKHKPSCAILVYPESHDRFNHDKDNRLEKYIRGNYDLIYQSGSRSFVYKYR